MTKKLLLYVPGFPGEAILREPGETRIIDIVTEIMQQKNINFEVISYPGINDEGVFTFEKSKHHTFNAIKEKINQGYSLTIIGHSWGGLLSLLALDQFKFDQLLLITPFLLNLDRNDILSILKNYSNDFPKLIPIETIEKNTNEVQSTMNLLINVLHKKNNQTDIKVFINIEDEIVPIDILKNLIRSSNVFKSKVTLTTSSNDHNFSKGTCDLRAWIKSHV